MQQIDFEAHQLVCDTDYIQWLVITCRDVNMSLKILQHNKGPIPTKDKSFLRGGRLSIKTGSANLYMTYLDDVQFETNKRLNSDKGYKAVSNIQYDDVINLLRQIAIGNSKFSQREYIVEKVQRAFELLGEPLYIVDTSSNEIAWLANYWGATA